MRRYHPEIALLVLNVQKQSVGLIREELVRQAEWLNLGSVRVGLQHVLEPTERRLRASLGPDTDVVQAYHDALLNHNPGIGEDADKLTAEIRRYHGLRAGPPLERVQAPPGPARTLEAEDGPGEDVAYAALQRQSIREPVAYAERRFGSTGPFLRRRKWNIDFYEGPFEDLTARYRKLGYRSFYRLRAPYISYGRHAYLLGPEPGRRLRPRLVYCDFYSRDLFIHTRAQYAVLRRATGGADPIVQTLRCKDCPARPSRALAAVREVLDSAPFQPTAAVMGYESLFEEALAPLLAGVYDNDYWRVRYYDGPRGVIALLEARQAAFGEAAGEAMSELAARGAAALFFAGPAAVVGGGVKMGRLYAPQQVHDRAGQPLPWTNALQVRGRSGPNQSLPSPLLATSEWLAGALSAGVETVDTELAEVVRRVALREPAPQLGVAVITTSLSSLHPEEDRAVYTVELERQEVKEAAKKAYRDQVLRQLGVNPDDPTASAPGRDR